MLVDTEVRVNRPVGEWSEEGGSDGRNDAGEEGGATKGSTMGGGRGGCSAVGTSVAGAEVSGTITACPICLLFL